MLRYLPEDRATPNELAAHSYIRSVTEDLAAMHQNNNIKLNVPNNDNNTRINSNSESSRQAVAMDTSSNVASDINMQADNEHSNIDTEKSPIPLVTLSAQIQNPAKNNNNNRNNRRTNPRKTR